jgi:hypothetical protein
MPRDAAPNKQTKHQTKHTKHGFRQKVPGAPGRNFAGLFRT